MVPSDLIAVYCIYDTKTGISNDLDEQLMETIE